MTHDVAIVGAGAAGLGAAYALGDADAGADVTVFEKRRGVCGRAATRRRHGCRYDYGANYVKSGDERVAALLTERLDADGLVDVAEPVWVFDAEGTISEGRDADEHKWTYESGIAQLGERLLSATDATVHRETRIEGFARDESGWHLVTGTGREVGGFDALLLTPPAPQTADLLGAANWESRLCRDLREAVAVVPYRTVVSAVLHYPFEVERPFYGLVDADKAHDVGWCSREECKPGHVPDGESLLVVQMAPGWSVDNYDLDDDALAGATADRVADLLDEAALADPDWTDVARWRYAQPDGAADTDLLEEAAAYDLYFAGDWVVGEGRVHRALGSGLDAGERIADALRASRDDAS